MNIRNTTTKERMLKSIRQALLQKRDNPHPDFEDSQIYKDEEEGLDVTFAREFTSVSGKFVYCDGEISVIENLIFRLFRKISSQENLGIFLEPRKSYKITIHS